MLRYFKRLINAAILLTFPTIFLYPQRNQAEIRVQIQKINLENQQAKNPQIPLSNEILLLMNHLESGELEKN